MFFKNQPNGNLELKNITLEIKHSLNGHNRLQGQEVVRWGKQEEP